MELFIGNLVGVIVKDGKNSIIDRIQINIEVIAKQNNKPVFINNRS